MLFEVVGTLNGKKIRTNVDAVDRETAWAKVKRKGVLVEKCAPISAAGAATALRVQARPVPPPMPLPYAEPSTPSAYSSADELAQAVQSVSAYSRRSREPHHQPREVVASPLGIAALVIAIIAAGVCWIPFLGMAAFPLGGIGLILALIGFIVALAGRRSGVGFPIAGAITAIVAITCATLVTGGMATVLNHAALAAAHQANLSTNTGGAAEKWFGPADTIRRGDVAIRLTTVRISKIRLRNAYARDSEFDSSEQYLIVGTESSNLSPDVKISYRPISGSAFGESSVARLSDDVGNNYKRIDFGIYRPVAQAEPDSIYPGKSIEDVIAFELPVSRASVLRLELPAENIGSSGENFRYEIRTGSITRIE